MRRLPLVSASPFGLGHQKPQHFREMAKILWDNRGKWNYAWRVLNDGVCDGCALGTSGMRDWTIDGTHLCAVRLNLLRLNTMGAFSMDAVDDVAHLRKKRPRDLRELGRIPFPMRRRPGERGFTRISWDEAEQEIGQTLGETEPDRAACYMTSRGITNEVYFAAQKAWRAYGSPHIDNAARLCHSPSTAAMKKTLGAAAATCSYRDWYDADVIVFFGSNVANDQPVTLKYLYEAKKRGARVLCVNTYREPGMERYWIPSNTDSAVFGTEITDEFFHVSTGGDLAFIYAVQKILIGRGAVDSDFIRAHTDGFDGFARHLAEFTLEDLISRAGSTQEDVIAFADEIENASTGVFVWSMGITQHTHGTDSVAAICTLGMSQGFIGKPGCGMMPIRGHSGVQGGAEMGAYATVFPGRAISEQGADELEALWGFRPPARAGYDTVAMVAAAGRGELDVLYAIGGNFTGTLPQPDDVDRALSKVKVRVHQDIFFTTSMLLDAQEAVYVLPAKTRYEHVGGVTETTTERRVIFSPHVPGHEIGEAREEWAIPIALVAAAKPALAETITYANASAIREDISQTISAYEEIKTLKKKGDQFQWGGPRLCEGGNFGTQNGKGQFTTSVPPDRRLPAGKFHLATRRGKQFNSIIQADVDQLTGAARDHVFISQADARALGVKQNQAIVVQNDHGKCDGRVFIAPITNGSLQMHWPEANVLLPTGPIEPGGRVPDYNTVVEVSAR